MLNFPTLEFEPRVEQHKGGPGHDQKAHGNWARLAIGNADVARIKGRIAQGVNTDQDAIEVGRMVVEGLERKGARKLRMADNLDRRANAIFDAGSRRLKPDADGNYRVEDVKALFERIRPLQDRAGKLRLEASDPEEMRRALDRVRPMGKLSLETTQRWSQDTPPEIRAAVSGAERFIPADWLSESHKHQMRGQVVERGFYQNRTGVMALSGVKSGSHYSVAVHEWGHRADDIRPQVRRLSNQFYLRRTKGSRLEWLGAPYDQGELTRRDRFIDPYMGKDYRGKTGTRTAFEVMSMGLQGLFAADRRLNFSRDPEYKHFIVGVLASA
jgi:hypothetical protein